MKVLWTIRIIAAAVALFCMGFIFYNSAKTASESRKESTPVSEKVISVTDPTYKAGTEKEQKSALNKFDRTFRKYAHVAEFLALAAAVSLFLLTFPRLKWYFAGGIALLFCFLYAMSDEWHQTFVKGRTGSWTDVGTDMIGVAIGCLLVVGIWLFVRWIRKRKQPRAQADLSKEE